MCNLHVCGMQWMSVVQKNKLYKVSLYRQYLLVESVNFCFCLKMTRFFIYFFSELRQ